jgi:hypothetical protein
MNDSQAQGPVYRERESHHIQTPVSVGEWMITILLMAIPIVNIIMLFIWAFSGNINISKANWAKATLIWWLIIAVVYALLFILLGSFFAGLTHMNW